MNAPNFLAALSGKAEHAFAGAHWLSGIMEMLWFREIRNIRDVVLDRIFQNWPEQPSFYNCLFLSNNGKVPKCPDVFGDVDTHDHILLVSPRRVIALAMNLVKVSGDVLIEGDVRLVCPS